MRATTIVVLSAFLLLPIVQADVVTPIPQVPAIAREHGSLVWTGDAVYVFGGANKSTIVRYDPATGEATTMGAKLPTVRHYTSAIWTGEKAYIFGGNLWTSWASRDIVEYDPATDTVRLLDAKLPVPVQAASAVWTGEVAYVLGGDSWVEHGVVARFDPASETVTRLPWKLPDGYGAFASGAWASGYAILAGGYTPDWSNNDVLRVDVETGETTIYDDRLGRPTWTPSVMSDGLHAYVFGGGRSYDEVLRHDPTTGHTNIMPGRIRSITPAAVWADDRALVLTRNGCSWCPPAFEYVPQAEVPRPSAFVAEPEYRLWKQEDGGWYATYEIDVEVKDAPIYDLELRVAPARAPRHVEHPIFQERTAINWFEITRLEEGRTQYSLLFVVRDVTPLPEMCLRIDAHSGSTLYGAVSSEPKCVPLTV